jgi:hypothetical protein
MKKFIIIVLSLAIASANLNSHSRFIDTKTVLTEVFLSIINSLQIDAEPFGNIILSTVQAHLAA